MSHSDREPVPDYALLDSIDQERVAAVIADQTHPGLQGTDAYGSATQAFSALIDAARRRIDTGDTYVPAGLSAEPRDHGAVEAYITEVNMTLFTLGTLLRRASNVRPTDHGDAS